MKGKINQIYQLKDLPLEIHQYMFSFLAWEDMDRMACVSKYWHKLNKDMLFTKIDDHYIRLDNKIISMEVMEEKLNTQIKTMENMDKKVHGYWTFSQTSFATLFIIIGLIITTGCIICYAITFNAVVFLIGLAMFTIVSLCIILFLMLTEFAYLFWIQYQEERCEARIAKLERTRNFLSKKLKNLRQKKNEV